MRKGIVHLIGSAPSRQSVSPVTTLACRRVNGLPATCAEFVYGMRMPAPTNNTLLRQWELLRLLPLRGTGKTSAELTAKLTAAGYPINERSVTRDLHKLSRIFDIACNDGSKPYGWRWSEQASTDLPGLGLTEALTLQLLAGELRRLLPASLLEPLRSRFEQAERKLKSEGGRRAAAWLKKVRSIPRHLELQPPKIAATVLHSTQEALMADEQLAMTYQSLKDPSPRARVVEPRALIQRGGVAYLIANAVNDSHIRQYALHRMTAAEHLSIRVQRLTFDLDDYVAAGSHEIGEGKLIEFKAKISANLAKILRETPLTQDMKLENVGDSFVIEAQLRDNLALHRWILGHDSAIEVLAPAPLRRAIAARLGDAIRAYR